MLSVGILVGTKPGSRAKAKGRTGNRATREPIPTCLNCSAGSFRGTERYEAKLGRLAGVHAAAPMPGGLGRGLAVDIAGPRREVLRLMTRAGIRAIGTDANDAAVCTLRQTDDVTEGKQMRWNGCERRDS